MSRKEIDLNDLAPDVRQKLLALTMYAYQSEHLELTDLRVAQMLEPAVRMYYNFEILQYHHDFKYYDNLAWEAIVGDE